MTEKELIKKFEDTVVNEDGTINYQGWKYDYIGVDMIDSTDERLGISAGYGVDEIGILVDTKGNEEEDSFIDCGRFECYDDEIDDWYSFKVSAYCVA